MANFMERLVLAGASGGPGTQCTQVWVAAEGHQTIGSTVLPGLRVAVHGGPGASSDEVSPPADVAASSTFLATIMQRAEAGILAKRGFVLERPAMQVC